MHIKNIVVLVFIGLLACALQIFLSLQKNKWLGLIIPILNALVSILFVINALSFLDAIKGFLLTSIFTGINLIIYFICRNYLKNKTLKHQLGL